MVARVTQRDMNRVSESCHAALARSTRDDRVSPHALLRLAQQAFSRRSNGTPQDTGSGPLGLLRPAARARLTASSGNQESMACCSGPPAPDPPPRPRGAPLHSTLSNSLQLMVLSCSTSGRRLELAQSPLVVQPVT